MCTYLFSSHTPHIEQKRCWVMYAIQEKDMKRERFWRLPPTRPKTKSSFAHSHKFINTVLPLCNYTPFSPKTRRHRVTQTPASIKRRSEILAYANSCRKNPARRIPPSGIWPRIANTNALEKSMGRVVCVRSCINTSVSRAQ